MTRTRHSLPDLFSLCKRLALPSLLFFSAAVLFAGCGILDDDDEPEEEPGGDPFDDVPEAYILTSETVASSCLPGDGMRDKPYHIRNAAEMLYFIEHVNNGTLVNTDPESLDWEKTWVVLDHDIEVADNFEWHPVGSVEHPYYGDFDGKSHTISGRVNISSASPAQVDDNAPYGLGDAQLVGLFGYVESSTIENLNVSADVVSPKPESNFVCGAIVAASVNTYLTNLHFSGQLAIPRPQNAFSQVYYTLGGIIGRINTGHLYNSSNDGSFRFGTDGLSGKPFSAIYAQIGGLAGFEQSSYLGELENNADITIDKGQGWKLRVGGILGYRSANNEIAPAYRYLQSCTNRGNITLSNLYATIINDVRAEVLVGGIYGEGGEDDASADMPLVNYGNISVTKGDCDAHVGGIGGKAYRYDFRGAVNHGDITNKATYGVTGGCYGTAIGDIEGCVNNGKVTSTIKKSSFDGDDGYTGCGFTGGIAGYSIHHYLGKAKITDCINNGAVNSAADMTYLDVPMSRAGAIAGSAQNIPGGCSNTGTVNGVGKSDVVPEAILNGATWLAWEMIGAGRLTPESNYAGYSFFSQWVNSIYDIWQ